ncbi:MAG: hypothetical protein P8046_03900, partial [Anaerolineales bacterium]
IMTDKPENELFITIGDQRFRVGDKVYIIDHRISNVRRCIGNTGTIIEVSHEHNAKVQCDICGNDGVIIDRSAY